MPTPEGAIENQIIHYLRLKRIFVFKVKNTGVFDPTKKIYRRINANFRRGVSDLVGIYNMRFLAIEVKTPKGRATDEQLQFLQDVRENGGIAFIARSVEDVEKGLQKWGVLDGKDCKEKTS